MEPDALHSLLREAVRDRADALDGGVLAPGWVKALSEDEEVAGWEAVLADSELLADHHPQASSSSDDLARCAADGKPFPCEVIARLATAYGGGDLPR